MSDLDALLRGYIDEERARRVSDGERIDKQTLALQRIFAQLELHEQKDDSRHGEVKNALAGMNARVEKLERGAEDTGRHNVEELNKRLAEMKAEKISTDAALKASKERGLWVVAKGFGALVVVFISAWVGSLFTKGK